MISCRMRKAQCGPHVRGVRHFRGGRRSRRGLRFGRGAALFGLPAIVLGVTAGCGNPLLFQGVVDRIFALEPFGGAAVRVYSSPEHDNFSDVIEFNEEILVVGTIAAPSGTANNDGSILRIAEDGDVLEALRFGEPDGGPAPYLESFTDVDVQRATGAGDTIVVAGGRYIGTGYQGLLFQFQLEADGLAFRRGVIIGDGTGAQNTTLAAVTTDGPGGRYIIGVGGSADGPLLYVDDTSVNDDDALTVVGVDDAFTSGPGFSGARTVEHGAGEGILAAGMAQVGVNNHDVLLVGFDVEGNVLSALQVDFGQDADELVTGMDRVIDFGDINDPTDDTESFVIVGSTRAYENGNGAWFVLVATWDGTAAPIAVERAIVFQPYPSVFNSAQAVVGAGEGSNYWGRDNLFMVTGDYNDRILMDTSGEVIWATGTDFDDGIPTLYTAGSRSTGAATNNATEAGFYIVGANQADESARFGEGTLSWVLPDDGQSPPHTEAFTRYLRDQIQEVTRGLRYPPVSVSAAPVPDILTVTEYAFSDYTGDVEIRDRP